MHALTATLCPASLYSMRLPYTHQSALTYPLPPPSTIKGMLANALQRAHERAPLDCLEEVERRCLLVTSSAPGFVVSRSCVVRLVTDPHKGTTNALPREFAYARAVRVHAVSEDGSFLERCRLALQTAPVSLGDSESLVTVLDTEVSPVEVEDVPPGTEVTTDAYAPRRLFDGLQNLYCTYWVHETCLGAKELRDYVFPLVRGAEGLTPTPIRATLRQPARRFRLDDYALVAPAD